MRLKHIKCERLASAKSTKHKCGSVSTAKLLRRAKQDIFEISDKPTRGWGNPSVGEMKDPPALTSSGNGSHKPPLLVSLENTLVHSLLSLNMRYKKADFLLPASAPDLQMSFPDSCKPATPKKATEDAINLLLSGYQGGIDDPIPDESSELVEEEGVGREEGGDDVELNTAGELEMCRYRAERILVFRKAAHFFSRSFKTYKPLLAWIFAETDAHSEAIMRLLAQYRSALAKAREGHTLLAHALRESEGTAKIAAKLKNREVLLLKKKLASMDAQEKHTAEETAALRDMIAERDASLADMEEVKVCLQKSCSELEKRLHQEKASYNERISVKQTVEIERATREAEQALLDQEAAARENKYLKEKIIALETIQQTLTAEKEQLEKSHEQYTPRPAWDESPICDSLAYKGATSTSVYDAAEQILELEHRLLELQKSEKMYKRKWFAGLGPTAPNKFLRHTGRIRNMNLRKPIVEQHIRAFWKDKQLDNDESCSDIQDFFMVFLERKYGAQRAHEWAYNLWYSLQRYDEDSDCSLFLSILNMEIDEGVWFEEKDTVSKVCDELILIDTARTGVVNAEQLIDAIKAIFPGKPDHNVRLLAHCLESDDQAAHTACPNKGEFEYVKLFEDDDDCYQSPVVEMLRQQNMQERTAYIADLADAILSKANEGIATKADVTTAIKLLDPYVFFFLTTSVSSWAYQKWMWLGSPDVPKYTVTRGLCAF